MEKAVHLLPHTPDYGHHYHQSFSRHLGHESYGLQPGKLIQLYTVEHCKF